MVSMNKLLFRFKGYKNGEMVFMTTRKKKTAALYFIKANFSSKLIDKVYFKVLYGHQNINEGEYRNFKHFEHAYRSFTDPWLIEYVTARGW